MEQETEVAPQEATEEDVVEEATQETEVEGESQETTDDEPKRKSRHQRRKEQIERYRQEAEAEREKSRDLEVRLAEAQKLQTEAVPPKEADFGSYEEYQAALSGFHAMKQMDGREAQRLEREHAAQKEAYERAETQRQHELQQSWVSQAEEAKERYADFDAVISNPTVPIPQHVADTLLHMDAGADVAYHLGTNVDVAAQIAQLPPVLAAMELGKIEATLSRPSPQKITTAPDPITPVRAKSTTPKSADNMSMAEYEAARKAGKIR
jgi:hypothetical protein